MMEDQTPEEPRLSYEENWDLIFSLFGSAKDLFAEYGGGEACLRAVRGELRLQARQSTLVNIEILDEPALLPNGERPQQNKKLLSTAF